MSIVYLYHLESPLGSDRKQAQHYLGSCADLAVRDATHRAGRGARILAAAVERGIGFRVVRIWPGGRAVERWLKNRKEAATLCPVCAGARAWSRASTVPQALQHTLPLDEPLPDGPTLPIDGYEIATLKGWRRARARPVPTDLTHLDDLL